MESHIISFNFGQTFASANTKETCRMQQNNSKEILALQLFV